MVIRGKCDLCPAEGEWDAEFYDSRDDIWNRPEGKAAIFPWNKDELPMGCTFDPVDLGVYEVETAVACPSCCRGDAGGSVVVEETNIVMRRYVFRCYGPGCNKTFIYEAETIPELYQCPKCRQKKAKPLFPAAELDPKEENMLETITVVGGKNALRTTPAGAI